MSLDRDQVYESRQRGHVREPEQPREQRRDEAIQYVVETTQKTIDAYVGAGFSMDVAILMTSQILPKLL